MPPSNNRPSDHRLSKHGLSEHRLSEHRLSEHARLGPYDILSLLGAGGMGEVYLAEDTRLRRRVALKVLPGAIADEPERLRRLQREAEALAALNHPNIERAVRHP